MKSIGAKSATEVVGSLVIGLRRTDSKDVKRFTVFLDRKKVIRVTRRRKGEHIKNFSCVVSITHPNTREFDYINRLIKAGFKMPHDYVKVTRYKKVK